jgi:hypothetical protein
MLKNIFAAAWLALAAALPAFATTVLPLDLGQVIDQATTAFQGTVTENRSGRDPQTGMLVTFTTFRVDDVLKGEVPASYTIKQIGGEDAASNTKFRIHGVPTFTVGQSYVVFMAGVSQAGFSSPIGLAQGRFTIEAGDTGALEVGNGNDFRELTANMPDVQLPAQAGEKAQGKPVRRIGLSDFKQMVRKHAGSKQ